MNKIIIWRFFNSSDKVLFAYLEMFLWRSTGRAWCPVQFAITFLNSREKSIILKIYLLLFQLHIIIWLVFIKIVCSLLLFAWRKVNTFASFTVKCTVDISLVLKTVTVAVNFLSATIICDRISASSCRNIWRLFFWVHRICY